MTIYKSCGNVFADLNLPNADVLLKESDSKIAGKRNMTIYERIRSHRRRHKNLPFSDTLADDMAAALLALEGFEVTEEFDMTVNKIQFLTGKRRMQVFMDELKQRIGKVGE